MAVWFVLRGAAGQVLTPDFGEFHEARWWSRAEIDRSDPAVSDPHLRRMLAKLDQA